jgi:threonine dehydrogenase-like Zn-dependent dehydrogenase
VIRGWRWNHDRFTAESRTVAAIRGFEVAVAIEAVWLAPGEPGRRSEFFGGQAAVGTVIAAGEQCSALLFRRVVVGALLPCGDCGTCQRGAVTACPQRHGLGVTCDGAAGDQLVVPGRWVTALESDLALSAAQLAAAAGPLAMAYGLYARAGVAPREKTRVIGQDVVGDLLRQILAAKGAPASEEGDAPSKIFETTGEPAARAVALSRVAPRSTVVLQVSPRDREVTPLPASALRHEGTVLAVAGCHPDLLIEVIALLAGGDVQVSERFDEYTPDQLTQTTIVRPGVLVLGRS